MGATGVCAGPVAQRASLNMNINVVNNNVVVQSPPFEMRTRGFPSLAISC